MYNYFLFPIKFDYSESRKCTQVNYRAYQGTVNVTKEMMRCA